MTVSVEPGDGTLEIRAHDLVHYDEESAHFSVPYRAIRQVRSGPYAPPAGSFTLANREVAYADVRAGHFRQGESWTFCAYDDAERTVIVDLEDFDFALRPYGRLVLAADDPAALAQAIRAGTAAASRAEAGDLAADIAWTALGAGMAVLAKDGRRVGTVTHPLGDIDKDVFEGVAFRSGALGHTRMARPDDIARLTADTVQLSLSAAEAEALPPVQLEDLREVAPGRGIFRHPRWRRDDTWNDAPR